MPFVRQVRAHQGEVVEIRWTLDDGTLFYQRIEIPPKATREARLDVVGSPLADGVGKVTMRGGPR